MLAEAFGIVEQSFLVEEHKNKRFNLDQVCIRHLEMNFLGSSAMNATQQVILSSY
jgi:hypothetical protein